MPFPTRPGIEQLVAVRNFSLSICSVQISDKPLIVGIDRIGRESLVGITLRALKVPTFAAKNRPV